MQLSAFLKVGMAGVQVLRTSYVATANGPQQILLPAAAVSVQTTEIATNGSPLTVQSSAGDCELRAGSTLATAWLQTATAPFDLYSDALIRVQVRVHQDSVIAQSSCRAQPLEQPLDACGSPS